MDQTYDLHTKQVATKPTTRSAPPEPFDFGVWVFRWFGAGIMEEWMGQAHPAAQLWAQRMLDTALTRGS